MRSMNPLSLLAVGVISHSLRIRDIKFGSHFFGECRDCLLLTTMKPLSSLLLRCCCLLFRADWVMNASIGPGEASCAGPRSVYMAALR